MRHSATTQIRGRFAPSTTGPAHPGTLLAALLCWLDAKSKNGNVLLRLEDLDPERSREPFVAGLERDLDWFGLGFDETHRQSDSVERYDAKMDELAAQGRLYSCDCSRSTIRKAGLRAPDGSFRYPGTCRGARLAKVDWRRGDGAIRIELDAEEISIEDESGLDLSGDSAELFGDPIVRRRDGAYAYHFASVLDDDAWRVNRIVRGRDLAPSTLLQTALRRAFEFEVPAYRHHALFLESEGDKLSKLHGAVNLEQLRGRYDAAALCGLLASFVGLVSTGTECRPEDLVADFDWDPVRRDDVPLVWSLEGGLSELTSGV